jgi:hypothetical protein
MFRTGSSGVKSLSLYLFFLSLFGLVCIEPSRLTVETVVLLMLTRTICLGRIVADHVLPVVAGFALHREAVVVAHAADTDDLSIVLFDTVVDGWLCLSSRN